MTSNSDIFYDEVIYKIYSNLLNKENILIIKSNTVLKDITYGILHKLNKYLYEISDYNIDINIITKPLDNNNYVNEYEYKKITDKALLLNREIEYKVRTISKIYDFFTDKNNSKGSLIELYSSTNQKIGQYDNKYNYYHFYQNNIEFMNKNMGYIEETLRSEISSQIIKDFIKYKKFSKNHLFRIIKQNSKITDINKAILKLQGLLNNDFALAPPIFNNEYTEDFIHEIININSIDDDEILEIARRVYNKHYDRVEVPKVKLLWYKPTSWIDYLADRRSYKKNKLQETKNHLQIYNEFKDNIDNLKLFKKSFDFLDCIITREYLEKISLNLLMKSELYNYLNNLEKVFLKYKEYSAVKESVEGLNSKLLELLELCYAEYKTYDELINLLEFIPLFYKYKEIDKKENENKDSIDIYHKLPKYIDELWIALQNRVSFIDLAIELTISKKEISLLKSETLNLHSLKSEKMHLLDTPELESNKLINIFINRYPITIIDNYRSNEFLERYGKLFDKIYYENDLEKKYLHEVLVNKKDLQDSSYPLKSTIVKLIVNLGYKVVKNYRVNDKCLDLVVMNPKDTHKVVAIYFDNMKRFDFSNLNYLLWLKYLKINTIFIWSKDWWEDKNREVSKIKDLLKRNLQ